MLRMKTMSSPVGTLRLFAREDALLGVYLDAQTPPHTAATGDATVLVEAAEQLRAYFAGERQRFDLPLAPEGTAFQRLVWRALENIPFGQTRTYGVIAHALGRPAASRAVGAANGQNPLSIIVPCHRVIGASGALTGYAGGLVAKQWLLAHEQRYRQSPHEPSSTLRD
ncbi:MAG: methylated-DNA--[protein]-cysteine S-methyltransferase [Myxococcales bacterium]|nr:methylated-DNA--[protein]-cysteine S-methyltransferase [Myxococcales bacterium]